jgi:hypothetical protein
MVEAAALNCQHLWRFESCEHPIVDTQGVRLWKGWQSAVGNIAGIVAA